MAAFFFSFPCFFTFSVCWNAEERERERAFFIFRKCLRVLAQEETNKQPSTTKLCWAFLPREDKKLNKMQLSVYNDGILRAAALCVLTIDTSFAQIRCAAQSNVSPIF
jgi:hypothetical protein